jgi:hypothetical protein
MAQGLGEVDAAHLVCERVRRYLGEFESLVTAPVFHAGEAIRSYTEGLRELISGVWHWHQRSGLYHHPRSLFAELRGPSISAPEASPRERLARCG